MKIYLAGRVSKNDWRHDVVRGLRGANGCNGDAVGMGFPLLSRALLGGHDYVGPYFIGCDHGCAHGSSMHGQDVTSPCVVGSGGADGLTFINGDRPVASGNERAVMRREIKAQCCLAIEEADAVFAWVEPFAYGTIWELGYSEAKDKRVHIGLPRDEDVDDLWFAFVSRYRCVPNVSVSGGSDAASACLSWLATLPIVPIDLPSSASHIEQLFWSAWYRSARPELTFQHQVNRYFVDFAHLETKTAIELDGMVGHSKPEDIEKDRRRQREIEALGWRFIRFGGREVVRDVDKCVAETAAMLGQPR